MAHRASFAGDPSLALGMTVLFFGTQDWMYESIFTEQERKLSG